MTDMDEAKMIEQAKAGDPKAQFELSQWARQMSILEPNEERWNRVAAKALVDAANGGYEPAKIMVQELISGHKQTAAAPSEPEIVDPLQEPYDFDAGFEDDFEDGFADEPAPRERATAFYDQAQEDDYIDDELDELDDLIDYENARMGRGAGFAEIMQKIGGGLKKAGAAVGALVGGIAASAKNKKARAEESDELDESAEDYDYEEDGEDYEDEPVEEQSRGRARAKKSGLGAFIEENWSVVKIVCIAVCAVLIVLIVILLLPSKEAETVVMTPMPTSVPATPVPTPEPFPNEATLLEIRSTATLQYRPADSEYLTASKTMTVICEGSENLRQGPGAGDYPDVVMQIAQGTSVTAYAKHDTSDTDENGNPICWYLLNSNGTWGWMYGPSLG